MSSYIPARSGVQLSLFVPAAPPCLTTSSLHAAAARRLKKKEGFSAKNRECCWMINVHVSGVCFYAVHVHGICNAHVHVCMCTSRVTHICISLSVLSVPVPTPLL